MLRTTIGQVVTVDRGDDRMGEAHAGDGIGNLFRLVGDERIGHAGLHVAEGAGPGAGVAHDHEGGVLLLPALANIGTARLLADRDEIVLLHDAVGLGPLGRARRLDANPVGLAQDRLIGPVRLLGMTRLGLSAGGASLTAGIFVDIEDDSHGLILSADQSRASPI